MSDGYFERIDEHTFRPTHWTSGAWRATEQHFSPIGGLAVHAIERHVASRGPADDLVLARVSFDILGVVELEPMDVRVDVVRPGRTIELLEATVSWRRRPVVRARAWRLARTDTTAVAGGEPAVLADPHDLERRDITHVWPGDYIRSLDVRAERDPQPGRGTVWIRSEVDLVAGEPVSDLARYVALVDTANGIAVRESPREWLYPNVDLSIHLYREPRGPWVGLDTTVVFGPTGQGLTSTVLHDQSGAVGRAEQTLTIRAMPGS